MVELTARGHDVRAGLEQPADDVDVGPVTHVEDTVGAQRHDLVDIARGHHPGRGEAAQLAGVLALLALRVDVEPDELELGVLDHRLQGAEADVPRGPLHDPVGPRTPNTAIIHVDDSFLVSACRLRPDP